MLLHQLVGIFDPISIERRNWLDGAAQDRTSLFRFLAQARSQRVPTCSGLVVSEDSTKGIKAAPFESIPLSPFHASLAPCTFPHFSFWTVLTSTITLSFPYPPPLS